METYFTLWTFVMFTFNVLVVTFGFGLTLQQMRRQTAHQDAIWQKLFTKADNTERMTQEILTRLADEKQLH
jgi:hypothetical protein